MRFFFCLFFVLVNLVTVFFFFSFCVHFLLGVGGKNTDSGWAPCAARLSHVSRWATTRERQCLLWGPGLWHPPGPQTQTLAVGGTNLNRYAFLCEHKQFVSNLPLWLSLPDALKWAFCFSYLYVFVIISSLLKCLLWMNYFPIFTIELFSLFAIGVTAALQLKCNGMKRSEQTLILRIHHFPTPNTHRVSSIYLWSFKQPGNTDVNIKQGT